MVGEYYKLNEKMEGAGQEERIRRRTGTEQEQYRGDRQRNTM